MSIELYIFILISAIVVAFYEMYNMKSKKSGDPTIWMFPFMIVASVSLIIKRCVNEFSTNIAFQKISNIGATISTLMFFIVFITTYIIAYRNNYIDKEKLKKLKPLIVSCLLIMLVCMVYIFYYKYNQGRFVL